ncbi:MAG: CoA ester lyase [Lautropia sp.]
MTAVQDAAVPGWPYRSLLFLPAHRIDWVRKVAKSMPDAVILDLEDAVPDGRKAEARALIQEAIEILVRDHIAPIVRINGIDAGGEADVAAVVRPGLAAVMLPKTHAPQDVRTLDGWISAAEQANGIASGAVRIIPLPETAHGMWFAYEIASASKRVTGLITAVSGPVSGDVSRAFGFEPTDDGREQLFLQSRTILASRAAGANFPIGTIMGTGLRDLDAVARLARRARQLGFSGAALIHPSHVAVANRVFRPSEEEVAYSAGLMAALADARERGDGAVSYQGMMIDAAMLPMARRVVEADQRYRARDALLTSRGADLDAG